MILFVLSASSQLVLLSCFLKTIFSYQTPPVQIHTGGVFCYFPSTANNFKVHGIWLVICKVLYFIATNPPLRWQPIFPAAEPIPHNIQTVSIGGFQRIENFFFHTTSTVFLSICFKIRSNRARHIQSDIPAV